MALGYEISDVVEVYNIAENTWTVRADLVMPNPSAYGKVCSTGRRLFLYSHKTSGYEEVKDIWVFDDREEVKWTHKGALDVPHHPFRHQMVAIPIIYE